MRHRNNDLLLRIAQGDAYGAGFEFAHPGFIRERHRLEEYELHPKHGCCAVYTDDTQMSIAVTEVLLAGPPFTAAKFADAFVRCFHRDPRQGYSGGFQKFLESVRTGREFLRRVRPDSVKNGAAMRAVPIGVLARVDDVLEVAAT